MGQSPRSRAEGSCWEVTRHHDDCQMLPSLNLLERRLSRRLRNLISTNWRAAPSMPRHLGHGRSGSRAAVISSRCVVGEAARLGFIANNPTVSGANSVTTGVSGSVNSAISRVDRAFVLYRARWWLSAVFRLPIMPTRCTELVMLDVTHPSTEYLSLPLLPALGTFGEQTRREPSLISGGSPSIR